MVSAGQDSGILGYKFSVESTVGQSFEYGMDRKRVTLQFFLVLVLFPIVIFMLRPAKHELVPGLRIALLVIFILSALITLFVFLGAWLSKDVKLVINEKGVRFGKASIPWRYISAVSVVRIGNSYALAFWPRDTEQLLSKLQPHAREKMEKKLQKRGTMLEVPDVCIAGGARKAMSHIDLFCIEQIRAHERDGAPSPTSGLTLRMDQQVLLKRDWRLFTLLTFLFYFGFAIYSGVFHFLRDVMHAGPHNYQIPFWVGVGIAAVALVANQWLPRASSTPAPPGEQFADEPQEDEILARTERV